MKTFAAALGAALYLILASCNEPVTQQGSALTVEGRAVQVLVANGLGETLSAVALEESTTVARDLLQTGLSPSHLVVHGTEGFLVNSLSHTIQVIDLRSKRTVRIISVGLGKNPMALALLPGSDPPVGYVSAFVAGEVALVNLGQGGGVLDTVTLPDNLPRDAGPHETLPFPGGLAVTGGKLFVALGNLRGGAGGSEPGDRAS